MPDTEIFASSLLVPSRTYRPGPGQNSLSISTRRVFIFAGARSSSNRAKWIETASFGRAEKQLGRPSLPPSKRSWKPSSLTTKPGTAQSLPSRGFPMNRHDRPSGSGSRRRTSRFQIPAPCSLNSVLAIENATKGHKCYLSVAHRFN